jgi:RNAse (barnase) inhibitor barstar
MIENFTFLDLNRLPNYGDALIGRVPAGILDSRTLLRAVADALSFPAYFGENWNALFDCLRDFHWTDKRNIVLIHEDMPAIPRDEMKVYLEVLRDATNDWKVGEPHELVVIFNVFCRNDVTEALLGE